MTKAPLYWQSPIAACDVCSIVFPKAPGTEMYDARTRAGPWANMCRCCFNFEGLGLGTGLGQKYVLQEDGRFLCVEGR
ncbi:hypothetical protein IB60_17225 [Brucella abortus LMN1]|nr:hypothetical protein IB60_17225 [Brucella abortus LMN1]